MRMSIRKLQLIKKFLGTCTTHGFLKDLFSNWFGPGFHCPSKMLSCSELIEPWPYTNHPLDGRNILDDRRGFAGKLEILKMNKKLNYLRTILIKTKKTRPG